MALLDTSWYTYRYIPFIFWLNYSLQYLTQLLNSLLGTYMCFVINVINFIRNIVNSFKNHEINKKFTYNHIYYFMILDTMIPQCNFHFLDLTVN